LITGKISQTLIDSIMVAYEVVGEGQPVLLLHGWGGRIESVRMVAEQLTPLGYQVHMLDLPGFGRSNRPNDTWGMADYGRFAAHYLDYCNLKPVHLIGHSFGGRTSIVLGADYPDYVNKIVLTASAGIVTRPTPKQKIRQTLFKAIYAVLSLPRLKSLKQRLQRWARNRYGSTDLRSAGTLEPIFRKVITEDLKPRAERIKAPTLLVWGDQDQDTPLWQGQELEKAIPNSKLVVFEGAGHFAYQERLVDFVRATDTFLKDANPA
jgi:pimeloyl-ACP methyl ester carboxylesterase